MIIEVPFPKRAKEKVPFSSDSYCALVNIELAERRVTYLSCQYAYAVKKKREERRKKNRAQMTARKESERCWSEQTSEWVFSPRSRRGLLI